MKSCLYDSVVNNGHINGISLNMGLKMRMRIQMAYLLVYQCRNENTDGVPAGVPEWDCRHSTQNQTAGYDGVKKNKQRLKAAKPSVA